MIRKSGFTLAEILIALTIIGVVAALTVPMLMSDTNAKTNKVMAKKAYATLSSALKIGQSKLDFDMSDITAATGTGSADSVFTIENFLTKTMDITKTTDETYTVSGKTLKISSGALATNTYAANTTIGSSTDKATVFKTSDGVYYVFPALEKSSGSIVPCTKDTPCIGYIDINGKKGPNELITCTGGTEALWTKDASMSECTVEDSAVGDVYPFVMYGATIQPANNAFAAILAD